MIIGLWFKRGHNICWMGHLSNLKSKYKKDKITKGNTIIFNTFTNKIFYWYLFYHFIGDNFTHYSRTKTINR